MPRTVGDAGGKCGLRRRFPWVLMEEKGDCANARERPVSGIIFFAGPRKRVCLCSRRRRLPFVWCGQRRRNCTWSSRNHPVPTTNIGREKIHIDLAGSRRHSADRNARLESSVHSPGTIL